MKNQTVLTALVAVALFCLFRSAFAGEPLPTEVCEAIKSFRAYAITVSKTNDPFPEKVLAKLNDKIPQALKKFMNRDEDLATDIKKLGSSRKCVPHI